MFDVLQRPLLRFLRVPPEPVPPAGGGEVRVFRASPRLYTLKRIKWGIGQVGALLAAIAATVSLRAGPDDGFVGAIMAIGQWASWLVLVVVAVVSYALVRFDFELRWYIVTDRSLRIREGVVRLDEKTMTFANIQHLTVRQGPLQRLLGIADLEVRTAGGGGGAAGGQGGQQGANRHIAYFRGVDNAEEIRAAIRDRIRHYRDAGLGDPDDQHDAVAPPGAPAGAAPALLEAARALTAEARALRGVVERAGAGLASG